MIQLGFAFCISQNDPGTVRDAVEAVPMTSKWTDLCSVKRARSHTMTSDATAM